MKGRGEKGSDQVNSKKNHPHIVTSLSRYFWAKPLFKVYSTASPFLELYKKNSSCPPSLSGKAHLRTLVTVQLNFTFCAGSPLIFVTSFHSCKLWTVDLILNIACSRLCNNLMSMFTGTACTITLFSRLVIGPQKRTVTILLSDGYCTHHGQIIASCFYSRP